MQTLVSPTFDAHNPVSSLMDEVIAKAHPEDPILKVAQKMAEHQLRHIMVVDRRNTLLGVISQRDIVRQLLISERQRSQMMEDEDSEAGPLVEELLTGSEPITIDPREPLSKAAALLIAKQVGCLPVVGSNGQLQGVLLMIRLLQALTETDSAEVDEDFTFFSPGQTKSRSSPAFIRRGTLDLIVPLAYTEETARLPGSVVLGYDEDTKRILVKFVHADERIEGAIRIKRSKDRLVIPARDFLKHFQLDERSPPFTISKLTNGQYLILTPKDSRVQALPNGEF